MNKELDEQLRLNSMGAEREYVLLGKVAQLERERDRLSAELKSLRDSDVALPEPAFGFGRFLSVAGGQDAFTEAQLRDYGNRRAMAERERPTTVPKQSEKENEMKTTLPPPSFRCPRTGEHFWNRIDIAAYGAAEYRRGIEDAAQECEMWDRTPGSRLAVEIRSGDSQTWRTIMTTTEQAKVLSMVLRDESKDAYAAVIDALVAENERLLHTLVANVHKAKGRYHSQLAMCALYDACGLPNETNFGRKIMIKTWQERMHESHPYGDIRDFKQAETNELRAALAERDAEIERLKLSATYAEHIDATPENRLQTMLHDTLTERDAQRKVLEQVRTALAERDAEIERLENSQSILIKQLEQTDAICVAQRKVLEQALVELIECRSVDDNERGRLAAITAIQEAKK